MTGSSERPDRPVFVGNFEYSAEEREVVRLLEKYGPVEKIDMKQGFAFVYMRYKDDGDEVIRKLDGMEWGHKRRPLKVQWAQKSEAERKRDARPSRTLFVVNFDVRRTTERDIEQFFSRYGRLVRVQIKKNYAFVAFADIETAIRAMDRANGQQLDGRTIAIEYVQNEDPNVRVADFNSDRDRDRGAHRARSRSRSRSPVRHRSPGRGSPRYDRRASPPPGRGRSRSPPRRASPPPARGRSPRGRNSPPPARGRSRSPPRRASPPHTRGRSRSPARRPSPGPVRGRSRSPRSRSPGDRRAERAPSYDR